MTDKELFREALVESWIGLFLLLVLFAAEFLGLSEIVLGFLAILIAVLFMNGLGKTELVFAHKTPNWWRDHKHMHIFHHITNEGEIAGILVGVMLLGYIYASGHGSNVHLPIFAAFALSGIMAVANMATKDIIVILSLLEKRIGLWGTVWIGTLLSSLAGAASSVFLCRYLLDRVDDKDKNNIALRLSAGIGLGNGLLPFVAPPILIVWVMLQEKLGWSLLDLLKNVGIIAVVYSGFITYKLRALVKPANTNTRAAGKILSFWLLLFVIVVIGNVIAYDSYFMIVLNGVVSIMGIFKGEDFAEKWQPIILGLLLMALEVIGHMADPSITWLVETILPQDMPILLLGLILFFATALVSHVADNALASRIFIAVVLSLPMVSQFGDFMVSSVLIGALFGGFLLIPANLPNFPIAKIFNITSGAWLKSALKIYWTAIIPIVWIAVLYFVK
jgi:hypothetical protein